ncbi:MAG: hypothetical protein M3040_04890 [Bacteroidota bacterium]|nr:hypothetical protein [Bacteroidota bacterium]
MHIYSHADLSNRHIQDQVSGAYLKGKLGAESFKKVLTNYPSNLYTPNYFVRIAMGLLTMVAIIFSALLVVFMFLSTAKGAAMYVILAAIYYTGLELFVKQKSYYNAGIDNLLMFFSAAFLIAGVAIYQDAPHNTIPAFVAIITCLYLSIRLVDGFMAVLAFVSFLIFVFLVYTRFGNLAKATAPLLLTAISVVVYLLIKKLLKRKKYVVYQFCFRSVLQVSLLTIYTCCNYFVVKEISNEMFGMGLSLNESIPLGWLFWILTFAIPIAYIAYGIARKDLMVIRTGLVLTAAPVFTFRYYYHIMAVEIAMLIAGTVLSVASYLLIKYLKAAKGGFSFEKEADANKERIDMKSLILAQVSGKEAKVDAGVEFGGGSFGSGGAGGNF